jgi:hypothetical protein
MISPLKSLANSTLSWLIYMAHALYTNFTPTLDFPTPVVPMIVMRLCIAQDKGLHEQAYKSCAVKKEYVVDMANSNLLIRGNYGNTVIFR